MAAHAFTDKARGVAYRGPATGAQATRAVRGLKVHQASRKAAIAGLGATMALGSVALWTVVPAGVLWLVSRLSAASGQLTLGVCLAVAVGIPTAIALGGQALVRVERVYMRMTGTTATARVVPGWRRSLSDSDALGPGQRPRKADGRLGAARPASPCDLVRCVRGLEDFPDTAI